MKYLTKCPKTHKERERALCLTIHQDFDKWIEVMKSQKYQYMIIGNETCPKTDKKHLQCYIYFKNARHFSALHKTFYPNHIEFAQYDAGTNKAYCSKESILFEDGEVPAQQGQRTDIQVCRDTVQNTNSMREVVNHATSVQGVRIAELWLKYHEPPRNFKPHVTWISGQSGIGKSRLAYEKAGPESYTCMKTGKWFEGYDAHENVIIDDIRKDFMKFNEFLQLIDRYAFRVECKGGSRQFVAKKIVITSIYRHEELWNTREDLYQLTRRIDECIHLGSDHEVTLPELDTQEIL